MNKQEVIALIQEHYDFVMKAYLNADSSEDKQVLYGMLKGYKSSLVLIALIS